MKYLYEIFYTGIDYPRRRFINAENNIDALKQIHKKEFGYTKKELDKLSKNDLLNSLEYQEDSISFILNLETQKYLYELK